MYFPVTFMFLISTEQEMSGRKISAFSGTTFLKWNFLQREKGGAKPALPVPGILCAEEDAGETIPKREKIISAGHIRNFFNMPLKGWKNWQPEPLVFKGRKIWKSYGKEYLKFLSDSGRVMMET